MTEASIEGQQLKLDRAKKHIGDLERAIQGFFQTDPYEVRVQDNHEAGRREHKVVRADPLPVCVGLIAGDALHCLRAALDHLIWQLVIVNGRKPDEMRTEFQVWKSETNFKSGRPGKAKGIGKEALDLFYGLKPYKGGNEALWRLHILDIVDKHRLMLAVSSSSPRIEIDIARMANELFKDVPGRAPLPESPESFGINAASPTLVEVGTVLFDAPLGDQSHDHVKPVVEIALNEPEISVGEPLVKTLHELASFVDEVINLFAPLIGGR